MTTLHDAPGQVVSGTCGWSDESIAGKFYPPSVGKSAEERLPYYS